MLGLLVGLLAVPPGLALTGVLAPGPAGRPPAATDVRPAAFADPATETAPDRTATAVSRSASRTARGPGADAPASTAAAEPVVHTVVGLGDSVPTGSACGCDDFVTRLVRTLGARQHTPVRGTNLAVGGATSADAVDQLADPHTRAALADADLVVVTIGANDVEGTGDPTSCPSSDRQDGDGVVAACYGPRLSRLEDNLDRLLGRVSAAATAPGARILVTGYWNVFLDGAIGRAKGPAYVELADATTRAVNTRLAAAAKAHGATYVDLFTAFRGSDGGDDCTALLADDGDHLSARGHALVARRIEAALAS